MLLRVPGQPQGVLGWGSAAGGLVDAPALTTLPALLSSVPKAVAQLGLLWGWNHKATVTFG